MLKRALVIDDEEAVRANVAELLREEGFEVTTADDGERGVAAAREVRPDVVVCDVGLPGLDGFGVLARLRAAPETRRVAFLFLTGAADKASMRKGMIGGADDYLTKPFTRAELLEAVGSRLARRDELEAEESRAEAGAGGVPGLPALILGKYRPLRLLAEGGMGAVYEALHEHTKERVALKVMHADVAVTGAQLQRFQREARVAAALKSEHVVRVMDADAAPELGGAPFIVMELLEGQDLETLAHRTGPARPEDVVDWLRPIARVLDRAHRSGIVHRDLKPENLFLAAQPDGPPIVKILDFGIVKIEADSAAKTSAGHVLGTPHYMAPEQATSNAATPATDRFALGLVVFRLLTGRHYHDDPSVLGALALARKGIRASPSALGHDLGAAFDAWFAQACANEPGRRYPSAVEQIEALAAALGLPVEERAPGRPGSGDTAGALERAATARAPSTLELAPTVAAPAPREEPEPGAPASPLRLVLVVAVVVALAVAALLTLR